MVRKVPLWNIPKCIQVYPNSSKVYKDILRFTKYQAAPGPGRTGRPRRRLVFCISWYIFIYLGYTCIYLDIALVYFQYLLVNSNGIFWKIIGRSGKPIYMYGDFFARKVQSCSGKSVQHTRRRRGRPVRPGPEAQAKTRPGARSGPGGLAAILYLGAG